ncbi:hypothetical protein IV38_GL001417 [Lactobacillus selangorensis]|uniref:DUF1827 family protein n=1 Tax=Lactobacillus selangorensis TaxID=81857 RepID=A0A0R2FV86_9LACO|nr:DUF1827 family protein [Lactobacillus selangorensis]KRN28417.1 hypothetical protein IV38_GL001417 [Lactobacillus selangorensis]KRN31918.1 hypothetical protein IV40_GL001204 [Lactobacillus selangorensis]
MHLFDITNSYSRLVNQQLTNTDANYVKVYSLGSTTVVYTRAATHDEILLKNDQRNIRPQEIKGVLRALKIPKDTEMNVIQGNKLAEIEISVPETMQ